MRYYGVNKWGGWGQKQSIPSYCVITNTIVDESRILQG